MDVSFAVSVLVAIFAIVNPIGNISFFTTLTQGSSHEEKIRIANKAIMAAAMTLIIFGLVGQYIFMLFSITIPAFRIAGGLLLIRVAFSMLYGSTPGTKSTDKEKAESLEREMIGVIPMGIPMLAGPGSISTVMLYISTGDLLTSVVVFVSIIVTMLVTWLMLRNADKIFARIGRVGSMAVSRIMGLILAAVAVQFLINGIHDVVLNWIVEFSALI